MGMLGGWCTYTQICQILSRQHARTPGRQAGRQAPMKQNIPGSCDKLFCLLFLHVRPLRYTLPGVRHRIAIFTAATPPCAEGLAKMTSTANRGTSSKCRLRDFPLRWSALAWGLAWISSQLGSRLGRGVLIWLCLVFVVNKMCFGW